MADRHAGRPRNAILAAALLLILIAAIAVTYFLLTGEPRPADEDIPPGQEETIDGVRLLTWNLYNFGRSKDAGEVAFIADVVRDFDLVAIQEVTTGPAGPQAVARLDDELDRRGAAWDYTVSDPTTGTGTERYAYLWKPSRIRLLGPAWLDSVLSVPVDREPYLARFEVRGTGRRLLVASFHAVPTSKNPAREVTLLASLHDRYPDDHLLVAGDFNLGQDNEAFDGLRDVGLIPVLAEQRTSLKMRRRDGEHLASEYDNIFFEVGPLRPDTAGIVDFTPRFPTLKQARTISDHLPVFVTVQWN